MIDLRSDTASLPTAGMRRAMAEAEVGDEQKREDPTVRALEERASSLLGQEAAVFVPTLTMANQIALRMQSEPGDVVLADAEAHLFRFELGGPAAHSGLVMRPLPSSDGAFRAEDVRAAVSPPGDLHVPATRILSLENTHNGSGGRVWPLAQLGEVCAEARRHGLSVHLDGARVFNAAVARGATAAEIGRHFDTVGICLSKGLGCPLGAVLATTTALEPRARRLKHMFGGAMRQAGIVAAAGLYALGHHIERLADDHANARKLASRLAAAGLPVTPEHVETNFVVLDASRLGMSADEAIATLRRHGVGASQTTRPGHLRLVTHLGISTADVDTASAATIAALGEGLG